MKSKGTNTARKLRNTVFRIFLKLRSISALGLILISTVAYAQTPQECFADPAMCGGSKQTTRVPDEVAPNTNQLQRSKKEAVNTELNNDVDQELRSFGKRIFDALSFQERVNIQNKLRELSLYQGEIDAVWGASTYKAVRGFVGEEAINEKSLLAAVDSLSAGSGRAGVLNSVALDQSAQPISNQARSKSILADVEEFVASGLADFDITFAKLYADVLPVQTGDWSKDLEDKFTSFETYVNSSDKFRQYRTARELARQIETRAEVAKLRSSISSSSDVLVGWVQDNLLDPDAKGVVEVVEAAKQAESENDIAILKGISSQIDIIKVKIGVVGGEGVPSVESRPVVAADFLPDALYVLGNFSGQGEHIYKGLSGRPEFDGGNAIACVVGELDQWERFALISSLDRNFSLKYVSLKFGDCRGSEDIVVASGSERQTERVPALYEEILLEELFVIEQKDIFKEKSKLEVAGELYEADIMNGSKIGYGFIIFNESTSSLCLLLEENKDDHLVAIEENKVILETFTDFNEGYALASDTIDAFKKIQRGECGSVYGDAPALSKLIDAAANNELRYFVAPAWVTPAALQEISEKREAKERSLAAQSAAREQSEALRAQANASAREKALVLQNVLQNRNGVRFSALVNELSTMLEIAVDFAFFNSPLDKDYAYNYTTLSLLDPANPTSSPFDSIISEIQSLSLEKWESTGFIVRKIDYGSVTYNGRALEGIITELNVSLKNRIVGDFNTYCRVVRAVQDVDFDMLRNVSVDDCGADHSDWESENSFASEWIVSE